VKHLGSRSTTRSDSLSLRRRRGVVALLASAVATALFASVVLVSAQPALALGCSISPSLQASAAREGIFCGEEPGDGPWPGGLGASPVSSGCTWNPNTDDLPEGFFDFTKYAQSYSSSYSDVNIGRFDDTTYVNGNRVTGEIHYLLRKDGTWILSARNRIVPGWVQTMVFDCATSRDGMKYELKEAPDKHLAADGTAFLVPPATTSPSDSDPWVTPATSRATAVPGMPGDYLVRINLANTSTASSPAHLSLDTSSYSVLDVLALAPGATCNPLETTEDCAFPSIDGGQSQTITLHIKLNTGIEGGTSFNFSLGSAAMMHVKLWAGDPSGRHIGFDQTTFDMYMPTP
jgi:hypothetical protein